MKHLRLFENFSDIDVICKKYGITNYIINKDGTVDVDGNVSLHDKGLGKLPIKFGKVTGYFYCSGNQLTTLDGCPNSVGGNFNCHSNQLTSLDGSPSYVGGSFYCDYNQLTTLEGGPKEVGGDLYCGVNPIFNVYDLFDDYKKYQDSLDYNYLRGTNIIKSRFQEALEEIGKRLPREIKGYNYR